MRFIEISLDAPNCETFLNVFSIERICFNSRFSRFYLIMIKFAISLIWFLVSFFFKYSNNVNIIYRKIEI